MGKIIDLPFEKRGDSILTGTVKWWNETQRMGFVTVDGDEYFINEKNPALAPKIKEGVRVRFQPFETIRGLEARNLEII